MKAVINAVIDLADVEHGVPQLAHVALEGGIHGQHGQSGRGAITSLAGQIFN